MASSQPEEPSVLALTSCAVRHFYDKGSVRMRSWKQITDEVPDPICLSGVTDEYLTLIQEGVPEEVARTLNRQIGLVEQM